MAADEIQEVLDVIKSRRSIRKYLDVPIEWDKIANVLEAGRFSPSSGNIQNFRFIVVTNRDSRIKLAEACLGQDWMVHAPVHILICADITLAKQYYGIRGERLYSIQNCAAAAQNMLIAATAVGLGSCWVGAFEEDMIRPLFKLPDYARPQAIITIGYSNEKPIVPPTYSLEHMTYLEGWGSKIRDGSIAGGYYNLGERTKEYVGKAVDLVGKAAKDVHGKMKDKLSKKD